MMANLYPPAKYTITLGELITAGLVDFESSIYDFQSFNESQRGRIFAKIQDRYWTAELAILPIGKWAHFLRAELNRRAPKANMLYKILDDTDRLTRGGSEHKQNRLVFSDFPQTQLSGKQDYATNANDFEEIIDRTANPEEIMRAFDGYFDPDEYLVLGVRSCFIPLLN